MCFVGVHIYVFSVHFLSICVHTCVAGCVYLCVALHTQLYLCVFVCVSWCRYLGVLVPVYI